MSEPAALRWLRSSAARERRAAEGRPPLADFWSRPRWVWLTLALPTLAAVASIVAGWGFGVLATLPLLMAVTIRCAVVDAREQDRRDRQGLAEGWQENGPPHR